jgi:hypothetical protein
MDYCFEWDIEKAKKNEDKHGVRFEEAASVFRDPNALSVFDAEHNQAEDRWLTLGISTAGRLLVVCHTFQGETKDSVAVRLISSRKATQKEVKQYRR